MDRRRAAVSVAHTAFVVLTHAVVDVSQIPSASACTPEPPHATSVNRVPAQSHAPSAMPSPPHTRTHRGLAVTVACSVCDARATTHATFVCKQTRAIVNGGSFVVASSSVCTTGARRVVTVAHATIVQITHTWVFIVTNAVRVCVGLTRTTTHAEGVVLGTRTVVLCCRSVVVAGHFVGATEHFVFVTHAVGVACSSSCRRSPS